MSFADDLNSIAKTPQQAEAEKKQRSIEAGEMYARMDYDTIKKMFKDKAVNGQYVMVEGKKVIEFEFEHGCFIGLFKIHDKMHAEKQLFGYKETSEINFIPKDSSEVSGYIEALERMAKEDGITLKLTGRHQVNQGPVQYFTIPGRLVSQGYWASKVWTKAVIVCKMSF